MHRRLNLYIIVELKTNFLLFCHKVNIFCASTIHGNDG